MGRKWKKQIEKEERVERIKKRMEEERLLQYQVKQKNLLQKTLLQKTLQQGTVPEQAGFDDSDDLELDDINNLPAMQQFKAIFMDEEKRNNRAEWRKFFISDTFLDAQYNARFAIGIHIFLQLQTIVPFDKLPDGLVIELAIVYVLLPQDADYRVPLYKADLDHLYDVMSPNVYEKIFGDIWNLQERVEDNFKELRSKASFIRRKSYDEYRTVRDFAINDTWTYKSYSGGMEEYKYTLSMAHWEFLADDDKVNSMDIEDIRLEDDITHACEVELFDYLLRKYRFPVEPCAYMYREFELEHIENTEYADVYKDLKAHILEFHPDMNEYYKSNITAVDYADQLSQMLEELQKKYERLGWGENFTNLYHPCYATEVVDWCEEEAEEVYKIVNSGLFQKYKYEPRVISKLIISQFSVTEAKILYDVYNKPELYTEDSRMLRLLHDLFSRMHIHGMQEEYLMSKEYEYDLGTDSYDFWEYFLSVAFGDRSIVVDNKSESPVPGGSLYGNKMTLPTYMRWTYKPSAEWRIRFTGYDKETGCFGEARKIELKVKEDLNVTMEFHYHYIRYFVNGEEVLKPAFDVNELCDYAQDDKMFLLLLPITDIYQDEMQLIYDRLVRVLPDFVRFEASVPLIAKMISRDNASISDEKGVKSRKYIENLKDCYRLDKHKTGKQLLYHYHQKYGYWEYVGKEMIGRHFRDTLFGEPDDEGWDMESFQESDLSLPYEVETKVHELAEFKTKDKIAKVLELFERKHEGDGADGHFLYENEVIFVFGDKDRIHLRQHLSTGVMLDEQMEQDAYDRHRYLSMDVKKIRKYAKEELAWIGWIELEDYHSAFPVAMGVSGSCYAFGITYDKGMKAKDFAKLFKKTMCLDHLTQVIEYEVQNRSQWDCGE